MDKILKLTLIFTTALLTSSTFALGENQTYRHFDLKSGSESVFNVPGLTRKKYLPALVEVDKSFPDILKEAGQEVRAFYKNKELVFVLQNGEVLASRKRLSKKQRNGTISVELIGDRSVDKIKFEIKDRKRPKTYFFALVARSNEKNIPVADLLYSKDSEKRSILAGFTFTVVNKGKNIRGANISLVYPHVFNIEKSSRPLIRNLQEFIQFIPKLDSLSAAEKKEMLAIYKAVLGSIEKLEKNEAFKDRRPELGLLSQDFQLLADQYISSMNVRSNSGVSSLSILGLKILAFAREIATTEASGDETPEISPSDPTGPRTPTNPGNPTSPSTPANPATPASPGTPGNPGSPGTPTGPGTPGNPGSPGTPTGPGTPGNPGSPGTPTGPGTPGNPGSPGTPTGPGTPGNPTSPTPTPSVNSGGGIPMFWARPSVKQELERIHNALKDTMREEVAAAHGEALSAADAAYEQIFTEAYNEAKQNN